MLHVFSNIIFIYLSTASKIEKMVQDGTQPQLRFA
jgi:hypothetical protein